jgi:phosphocarrier protein
VDVSRNGQTVNGKSIMGVMMLAASKGTTITVTTNGPDETEALEKIEDLINNRFDEAE